jgi:hypothetical protein
VICKTEGLKAEFYIFGLFFWGQIGEMNPIVRMMKQDPLKYAFYWLFIGALVLIVFLRVYFVLW